MFCIRVARPQYFQDESSPSDNSTAALAGSADVSTAPTIPTSIDRLSVNEAQSADGAIVTAESSSPSSPASAPASASATSAPESALSPPQLARTRTSSLDPAAAEAAKNIIKQRLRDDMAARHASKVAHADKANVEVGDEVLPHERPGEPTSGIFAEDSNAIANQQSECVEPNNSEMKPKEAGLVVESRETAIIAAKHSADATVNAATANLSNTNAAVTPALSVCGANDGAGKIPNRDASASVAAAAVAMPVPKPKHAANDPIAEKEQKLMDFYRSQGNLFSDNHYLFGVYSRFFILC